MAEDDATALTPLLLIPSATASAMPLVVRPGSSGISAP